MNRGKIGRYGHVLALVAAVAVLGLGPWGEAGEPAKAGAVAKQILFYSKSSEYEDTMVRRINGRPSVAERTLVDLGKENHLTFTFTKDGSVFTAEKLAQYDAFCFFTSGDLTLWGYDHNPPMTAAGKAALLAAIHNGKGFVGLHSAANTFNSRGIEVDPFIAMVGGELLTRVRGLESARQIAVDTNFPGIGAVPADFAPVDEWYTFRNYSTNLHVLLLQDTGSMGRGSYYGPSYPSTWAQRYGEGRVFYTSMGHEEAVWHSRTFQQILAGGLKWAARDAEAEVPPNLKTTAPQAAGP